MTCKLFGAVPKCAGRAHFTEHKLSPIKHVNSNENLETGSKTSKDKIQGKNL